MRIQCLLIALLSIFASQAIALASDPQALVLFNEPPNTYVAALEVVSLNPGSPVYSIAVLPGGKKQEIPRSGILAVVDYPPAPPKMVTDAEAAAAVQKIGATMKKYPQFQARLDSVLTKWNNAVALSRENAKLTATKQPLKGLGVELEIDGMKYRDATLTSFNGTEVGISHADGLGKIPATKLTPNQIVSLNTTSVSVHIDATRIAQAVMTPPPSSTGTANASKTAASRSGATEKVNGLTVQPDKSDAAPLNPRNPKIETEADATNVLLEAFNAELPGFEFKLNTLCRVFHLDRDEVVGEMAGLQLALEEAGLRTADGGHSKQAIAGAWRCVVWPRIAVEVTKEGPRPLLYKVMLGATLKEHVMYFSTKGKMHPGNETRLLSLLTTLNDREDRRLSRTGWSAADKEKHVMSVEETVALRDELLSMKDRSPNDRADLKLALVGRSGRGLFETLALDDFFGFAFGKSELRP